MHVGFHILGAVLALCFALGLNPFGCLFALGVLARVHWVELPAGLGGLGGWWVIGCFGVLALGEFILDKIPGLDVVWNLLQTLVRVPMAGVVAFAAAGSLPLAMRIGIAGVGMGFAGVAHGAVVALRVAAVSRPELLWNVALSVGEDGVALAMGWLALREPLLAGTGAAAMVVAGLGFGCCGLGRIRRGLTRRFGDRRVEAGSAADRRGRSSVGQNEEKFALAGSARIAGR